MTSEGEHLIRELRVSRVCINVRRVSICGQNFKSHEEIL